jgi:hypothetical protein
MIKEKKSSVRQGKAMNDLPGTLRSLEEWL